MADESLSTARSNSQEEGKMGALTDFLGAGEVATALGEVVTALLDKLEHAVGWCANHDTPSRTAVNTYIEEIQNSDKDPLVKAALISNARKIVKEYCNQKNIVSIAIQSVKNQKILMMTGWHSSWIKLVLYRQKNFNLFGVKF